MGREGTADFDVGEERDVALQDETFPADVGAESLVSAHFHVVLVELFRAEITQ